MGSVGERAQVHQLDRELKGPPRVYPLFRPPGLQGDRAVREAERKPDISITCQERDAVAHPGEHAAAVCNMQLRGMKLTTPKVCVCAASPLIQVSYPSARGS